MTLENLAAIIPSAKAVIELSSGPIYSPGPHELLVKNTSLAFNPLEWKVQKLGFFTTSYPAITGFSFGGTVVALGSAVTGFSVGDRVVVAKSLNLGNQYGTFQKYALAKDATISRVPDSVSLDDASAVISNLMTTVGALNIAMGMERPPLEGTAPKRREKILIYGGSSVLGSLAAEFATRAGYTVVTTSSPKNKADVEMFASDGVIIDHTLSKDKLVDAIVKEGPYDYLFDTITSPATKPILAGVLVAQGGGSYWSVAAAYPESDLPSNVERKGMSYPPLVEGNEEVRKWFYEEYLPRGLESGAVSIPKIEKLKGGLGAVQDALDKMREGKTGGAKLIADPWET